MNYFLALFITFLLTLNPAYSQDKVTKHVVAKGETIKQIAQQYKVTPLDIYKLNPDAQNGLKLNTVLLIPKIQTKSENKASLKTPAKPIIHEVVAKETLYGIEKNTTSPMKL